jgi:hypothetical protein
MMNYAPRYISRDMAILLISESFDRMEKYKTNKPAINIVIEK